MPGKACFAGKGSADAGPFAFNEPLINAGDLFPSYIQQLKIC